MAMCDNSMGFPFCYSLHNSEYLVHLLLCPPMIGLIGSLELKLRASDQLNHLWTKQRMDMISRVTKAIAEWEPHGIFTHSHLSFV